MKAMKKSFLIMNNQIKYAVSEAQIMKELVHPYILKLNYAFQVLIYMLNKLFLDPNKPVYGVRILHERGLSLAFRPPAIIRRETGKVLNCRIDPRSELHPLEEHFVSGPEA